MDAITAALVFAIKFLIWVVRETFSFGMWLGRYITDLAARKSQEANEAKLMEAKTTHALGQAIERRACPDCGTENENNGDEVCFACGADLEVAVAKNTSDFDPWSVLIGFPTWMWGLGMVLLLGIVCQTCSALS